MFWTISAFFKIAVFQLEPKDLPASTQTLVFSILFALASYALAGAFATGFGQAFVQGLLDMMISWVFVYSFLAVQSKASRWLQVCSALAGSGAIINFIAVPVLFQLSATENASGIANLLMLLLFTWSLALSGYIFRSAFDLNRGVSIAVAIIYVLLVVSISQWLFPS